MEEARSELHKIINDREMKDALLLVFANKQDIEGRTSRTVNHATFSLLTWLYRRYEPGGCHQRSPAHQAEGQAVVRGS